ncbi:hypothetical protein LTR92_011263 [Exophiala xenobiotica]|nr:hypothetical protein LTR92_011263 [Exophiala xenobiotica]KAK5310681.1 hypothetical protein LTR93_011967 [Exophiala xenobiotica]KAK5432238.1 hypothetical protein LTR18_011247 [Exophiala xenobiotica]KAK5463856.1 hypothetical protein LTR55_011750 [Exophiala xenobiotica]
MAWFWIGDEIMPQYRPAIIPPARNEPWKLAKTAGEEFNLLQDVPWESYLSNRAKEHVVLLDWAKRAQQHFKLGVDNFLRSFAMVEVNRRWKYPTFNVWEKTVLKKTDGQDGGCLFKVVDEPRPAMEINEWGDEGDDDDIAGRILRRMHVLWTG